MAQLVFTSDDQTDIRIFRVTATISPQPIKATIEILAQIGESVTQDIPIINYSSKDWVIKVALTNNNVKAANFTGPAREIHVKKK